MGLAVGIFLFFVVMVLGLSFYLGSKAKSASGYFAAGGQIHYGVNGIAFAGDYLSAASFLGICGMIAFSGFDGYLYSIGYLAGWIVALFVVAEPMKRLGKYTFTDALDAKFNSKGIQLAAGISTLIVSLCYLIPQMVGAGVLVEPLLGLQHHWGVIMVGAIVIFIVATAGMASTTYVQFLKGGMLIVFSTVLAVSMCMKGLTTTPTTYDSDEKVVPYHDFVELGATPRAGGLDVAPGPDGIEYTYIDQVVLTDAKTKETKASYALLSYELPLEVDAADPDKRRAFTLKGIKHYLVKDTKGLLGRLLRKEKRDDLILINNLPHTYERIGGKQVLVRHDADSVTIGGVKCVAREGGLYVRIQDWFKKVVDENGAITLLECQSITTMPNEGKLTNGIPGRGAQDLRPVGNIEKLPGGVEKTGSLGPFGILATIGHEETVIRLWGKKHAFPYEGDAVTVYYPTKKPGLKYVRPGGKFPLEAKKPGQSLFMEKLNFCSLMLALFFGTSALPHILIRYYTVPSPADARKSTIVAIAAIGFFYILTMYLGMGATTYGVLNPATSNMSAPLFARSFGVVLFAIISALAFATVLGTVSGLIVAASGAVAHDLLDRYGGLNMSDKTKVFVGKLAAFTVGLVAIILGIVFRGMNVSFLVGWAFAVAASANLPAILMLLFWKKTTAQGIVASILVGIVAALGIILLGPDMFAKYGLAREAAIIPLGQPGIISIPLSFLTLVVVSLMTQKGGESADQSA